MGMLLAVLLGFGRLSSDSEAVALLAGGIGFTRIARPAVLLGVVAAVAGYLFNDPIASYADRRIVELKQAALNEVGDTDKPFDAPPLRGPGGTLVATVHIEGGYSVRARTMHRVTFVVYGPDGRPRSVIYAASAHPRASYINTKEWQLDDVTVNALGTTPTYIHLATSGTEDLHIPALGTGPDTLAVLTLLQNDPNALGFSPLRRALAALKRAGMGDNPDVRSAEVALWTKIALPLACVVFALVGTPLGLRPGRSSGRVAGMTLSLPIIAAYYVLYTVMGSVARGGGCPPIVAAFLPDVIGAALGTWLLVRRQTL